MIDPKTLKSGDVVTFGGKIGLTVDEVSYNHIDWKNVIRATYFDEPFWQIAELKKPELPEALNHYELTDGGNYIEHCSDFEVYSPSIVLTLLKQDVVLLEAAGVKETE